MRYGNVLLGDMGGTSFDTGIIVDNEIHLEKNLQLGLLQTGVNLVDVVSVGTGGGSIARVNDAGVPQVGPQSAGSEPGPAAYGFGGEDPTVTDAMVAMGWIDPARYLGGRLPLHPDRAIRALERTLTRPFGWSVHEAAAAVHDLVVENMATAVHEVSVGRGHDPREFIFLAYGGMLPLFAVQIAERLQIPQAVVPENSSVFSALGLLSADFVMRFDRTVACELGVGDIEAVNRVAREMVQEARAAMRAEGFVEEDIAMGRSADFRFLGQSYELTMGLSDRALGPDDMPELGRRFFELYEKTYGRGTAWKGVPVQLLNYTVTVTGARERHPRPAACAEPRPPEEVRRGSRTVFLPSLRETRDIPIYEEARFRVGTAVRGPAIIDAADTTIFVPPGARAERDTYRNYVLTVRGNSA